MTKRTTLSLLPSSNLIDYKATPPKSNAAYIGCRLLNSLIGKFFSAVAGFLPVISYSYIRLPLSFSVSLVLSSACLCIAALTYTLGQKCLGMAHGKSFFKAPTDLKLVIQYTAYRSIKAFLQSWGVVTGHLLAQRCFLLTPLVRPLTPIGAGIALVTYLLIDIVILDALRLTKEQKRACGFNHFHLSL